CSPAKPLRASTCGGARGRTPLAFPRVHIWQSRPRHRI
ncbi:MAG: hypothetical protein AVDCRST_MAG04-1862, partial [uncultured Acetobacteraceae bacterium]